MVTEAAFEELLTRKHAQRVLFALLQADDHTLSFEELREKVNSMIETSSGYADERAPEAEYSSSTLGSVLDAAEQAEVVEHVLVDGSKRWRLRKGELSRSQIRDLRGRNAGDITHLDTASVDSYLFNDPEHSDHSN